MLCVCVCWQLFWKFFFNFLFVKKNKRKAKKCLFKQPTNQPSIYSFSLFQILFFKFFSFHWFYITKTMMVSYHQFEWNAETLSKWKTKTKKKNECGSRQKEISPKKRNYHLGKTFKEEFLRIPGNFPVAIVELYGFLNF